MRNANGYLTEDNVFFEKKEDAELHDLYRLVKSLLLAPNSRLTPTEADSLIKNLFSCPKLYIAHVSNIQLSKPQS